MPTFDFNCKKCSATFEFSRPFGSDEHPNCPQCKSKRTQKLISTPTIHFKGSGFYATDSVSKPKKEKVEKKKDKKPKEAVKEKSSAKKD